MELNNKISELEVETAIVTYRQTLYQAFQEVDNAISARQHYQYQGEKLAEFYDAASAAEKIYASQYKNGAVSIQDWLDAKKHNAKRSNLYWKIVIISSRRKQPCIKRLVEVILHQG